MSTVTETLRSWAVQDIVQDSRAGAGMGVVAFAVATCFAAQVAVPLPLTPVPMTLQALFVILSGAMLGPRLGAAAMALYLMIGASGAPVFSNGGAGLPWLMGPTGGYLIAMPAAAFVSGWFVSHARGRLGIAALGLAAGLGMIYLGGVSQLLLMTQQSLGEVVAVGVLPFLIGDVTKLLVAVAIVRMVRPADALG